MKKKLGLIIVFSILVLFLAFFGLRDYLGAYPAPVIEGELNDIILPEGFTIDYYAQNVKGARSMAFSDNGILYVGTRSQGKVYALLDDDKDGFAEKQVEIASELNTPNGVALLDGDLYVATISSILKFTDIDNNLEQEPKIIRDDLPTDAWHGWKFIRFSPDNKLYVPVGAPCNVCDQEDPYTTMLRMNPDGTGQETFFRGMRNTVGFDWHPATNELWWTDNGRDWWGDDVPPDELNHAPAAGMHFGFPYCHGNMVDEEYNKKGSCDDYASPVQDLGAHVAALGMRFYTEKQFPNKYTKGVFIAEHGSWNRKEPVGYRVTFVELDGNKAVSYEPFAQGWLIDGQAWGRPVDVEVMKDGSLLVSDDANDAIYRISYSS